MPKVMVQLKYDCETPLPQPAQVPSARMEMLRQVASRFYLKGPPTPKPGGRVPYPVIRAKLAEMNGKVKATARALGVCIATVHRARDHMDGRKTKTCAPQKPGHNRRGITLAVDHPAVKDARTLFPTMVRDVGGERLLKSGVNSAKIGGEIFKGKWSGFKVYTLTLEERKTCPRSCLHYGSCYGNGSPYSRRFRHGAVLEAQLVIEVAALASKHPHGFAIRLHSLGDFYSVEYVEMWLGLLVKHPALHVFGYTARIDVANDPIAETIANIVARFWDRFAVRQSDGPGLARNTVSINLPEDAPSHAIICPAQMPSKTKPSRMQSESCGCCGFCWNTDKTVCFLKH